MKSKNKSILFFIFIVHEYVLLLATSINFAYAEDTIKSFSLLEEITVTARKHEELLNQIPGQVTVFDAQTIEDARIENIDDLFSLTPSLHFPNVANAIEAPLFIRGIGNFATGEPAVGLFVDGVYLFSSCSSWF